MSDMRGVEPIFYETLGLLSQRKRLETLPGNRILDSSLVIDRSGSDSDTPQSEMAAEFALPALQNGATAERRGGIGNSRAAMHSPAHWRLAVFSREWIVTFGQAGRLLL